MPEAVEGDLTAWPTNSTARGSSFTWPIAGRGARSRAQINQDERLDAIAERAVDAVDLAPAAPTDR